MRAQQGQIQGGSGAGNQASWTLPTASFENNSQPGRPKLGQNSPQQQQQHLNGIQASPSLLKAQASPNHLMSQGAVPTRSVSTPHQQAQPGGGVGGPFANQVAMSGGMGGHFPLAMNGPSGSSGSLQQGQTAMNSFPPPLDKARFEQSFRAYCVKKNLNVNIRQLQIDNRPVDLYQLHRNVMLESGVSKVRCFLLNHIKRMAYRFNSRWNRKHFGTLLGGVWDLFSFLELKTNQQNLDQESHSNLPTFIKSS